MKAEIQALRGRIAIAKEDLTELSLKIKGKIALVRLYADPFEEDILNLKCDLALVSAKELFALQNEYKSLLKRLVEMEDTLRG